MIENPVIDDERFLTLSEVEYMTGFKKHLSSDAVKPPTSEDKLR